MKIVKIEYEYDTHQYGTNPCAEIILRSKQFCNLSEVIVRPTDTFNSLCRKVRIAAIIGTWQSTLSDFRYLSKSWKHNTEEERLLGVSLTGIMDHPILARARLSKEIVENFYGDRKAFGLEGVLKKLKEEVIQTNKDWADKLGIPHSTATTAVKPSGTVSQLCDTASGIHPRYSEYYIRTVRADVKDPLAQFMAEKNFPNEQDVSNPHNLIFSFPVKSPLGSIYRNDRTAIEQLQLWKVYQDHWCEHKPSITVYVKEHEWMEVGAWVYKHFDSISGVSFLPHTDHIYRQAPYTEINKEQYEEFASKMPKDVDWSELGRYEDSDMTNASHELACSGGSCEL